MLICLKAQAQSTEIEFYASEPTTVYLFEPLDNAFNYQYATDTLYLRPKFKVSYSVEISDFKFIAISTSQLGRFIFPLMKGNKLRLEFKEKELSINGDNAAGLIYFNNSFVKAGLASYIEKISTTFDKLRGVSPYSKIYKQCLDEATKDTYRDIDGFLRTNQISKRFSDIFKTNIDYALSHEIVNKYKSSLKEFPEDSIDIKSAIDKVYLSCPIEIPNLLMYNYTHLYTSYYYAGKPYKKSKDFGAYSFYFSAPPQILLPSIGNALLIDFIYGFKSFDHEKVYSFLVSHFPGSDYVQIFKPLFGNISVDEVMDHQDSIKYITPAISRLKELSQLDVFKGKYLFIDLWATWCMPCKLEFQYTSVIHDLLKKYSNLCLLYLSIDEKRFNEYWQKSINNLHLGGFHLRVSNEKLYQDIVEKIYLEEKVTIPRYVLLSPDGEVLNSNLPRPSSQNKLKEVLESFVEE